VEGGAWGDQKKRPGGLTGGPHPPANQVWGELEASRRFFAGAGMLEQEMVFAANSSEIPRPSAGRRTRFPWKRGKRAPAPKPQALILGRAVTMGLGGAKPGGTN